MDSLGFDLVGMNARVEVYFQKYGLQKKRLNNLQLLLEELLVLLFREQFVNTQPDIEITVEYASETKAVKLGINYAGGEFNPFGIEEDDLGAMLIRGLCREKEHRFLDGRNALNLLLK